MEFFKQFRQERREIKQEREILKSLHPDFQLRHDEWLFNRFFSPVDEDPTVKARFAFDDSSQLKATDLQTKIGVNADRNIPHAFIGFAYASRNKKAELEEYAKQYPWAELITNLDREGLSTPKSEHILITKDA